MKSFLGALAIVAALATPALAGVSNEQIDATNFVVNQGCSGTLIDAEKRYILTASHCADAMFRYEDREVVHGDDTVTTEKVRVRVPGQVRQIKFGNGVELQEVTYRANIVAIDTKIDLALLQIATEDAKFSTATQLACANPARGDYAAIVGNPAGILYSSLVVGVVSSDERSRGLLYGDDDSTRLMQISGGIIGGNSGGAVYNDKGALIGVPVLGSRVNEVIGFAVPREDIVKFLNANHIGFACKQ